jgi:hypothetical protein
VAESSNVLLFDVMTPLGFRVRVTRASWDLIVSVKHPAMLGQEEEVQKTLAEPSEVRLSKRDGDVYLFYRPQRIRRWVCAVAKDLGGDGFLITPYPADAIKEGEKVWPR